MYFEIYSKGNLIARGNEILNDFDWNNTLMEIPSTSITLPITYSEYFKGREEVLIYVNGKCFHGIVTEPSIDKEEETIEVQLEHIISEWQFRQISVNNAIKAKKINIIYKEEKDGKPSGEPSVQDQLEDIYNDTNFAYPGWTIDMSDEAANTVIDYVYSRQNKLEALNQTMELTEDLYWRVGFVPDRVLEISKFGEKKQWVISNKPSGVNNISIITAPTIETDFSDVANLASVYSEKSDTGMSSLTLREVYNDPSLQTEGFPVVILRDNVNNERDYSKYTTQFKSLAPNNELEYAVIDEESVAMEGGILIETTFAFNDLSAFEVESKNGETKEITDADRVLAATTAYEAAKRRLRGKRRKTKIKVTTEKFPNDLNVGDRVIFRYNNLLYLMTDCGEYMQMVLSLNDWFYITELEFHFGVDDSETVDVTLEKFLYREVSD